MIDWISVLNSLVNFKYIANIYLTRFENEQYLWAYNTIDFEQCVFAGT
jgi:hypothetical protein